MHHRLEKHPPQRPGDDTYIHWVRTEKRLPTLLKRIAKAGVIFALGAAAVVASKVIFGAQAGEIMPQQQKR